MKSKIAIFMFLFVLIFTFSSCTVSNNDRSENYNLSSGIKIYIDDNNATFIDKKRIKPENILQALNDRQAKKSDVIIIILSKRASQLPLLIILDKLGDAKYCNVNITTRK